MIDELMYIHRYESLSMIAQASRELVATVEKNAEIKQLLQRIAEITKNGLPAAFERHQVEGIIVAIDESSAAAQRAANILFARADELNLREAEAVVA